MHKSLMRIYEMCYNCYKLINSGSLSDNLGDKIIHGTSFDDDIDTYDLNLSDPGHLGFEIYSGGGDDDISLSILGRDGFDYVDAGDGDDYISVHAFNSSHASMEVFGGMGRDYIFFSVSSPISFERWDTGGGTTITASSNNDGTTFTVNVSDTVEFISYFLTDYSSQYYLTEDLANGRIRAVDFSEVYDRAYGSNADWAVNRFNITSPRFSGHMRDVLSGDGDEVITYYLNDVQGTSSLASGDTINAYGHSYQDEAFIESFLGRLDPLIDLDFRRVYTDIGSDIDIYSVDQVDSWQDDTIGEVQLAGYGRAAWWDVLWKNTSGAANLSSNDKNTIVHEIGHALGLSHPNEEPYTPFLDSQDTVMSYNEAPNGWSTFFTSADINALQELWGVENDFLLLGDGSSVLFEQGYVYRLRNDLTGKFIFSANSGEIDIITGQGWVNEGAAYASPANATTDLHRFSMANGGHFYTANIEEKNILSQDSSFSYDGVAYQVYSTAEPPQGSTPVVRYLSNAGSHLYSTSLLEQANLDASAQWTNEGIAWYGESI